MKFRSHGWWLLGAFRRARPIARAPMRGSRAGPVPVLALALGACMPEEPAAPEVEYEVIEEAEFDESLGVDLDAMTPVEVGTVNLYIEDFEVGDGPEADWGDWVEMIYRGYLRTGEQYLPTDTIEFQLGGEVVPEGVHIAMLGQQAGGTRRMIIPPQLGYGARAFENVPAGSILIFDVELLAIE